MLYRSLDRPIKTASVLKRIKCQYLQKNMYSEGIGYCDLNLKNSASFGHAYD